MSYAIELVCEVVSFNFHGNSSTCEKFPTNDVLFFSSVAFLTLLAFIHIFDEFVVANAIRKVFVTLDELQWEMG